MAEHSIISINPTTGNELGRIGAFTRIEIDKAICTCQKAQKEWENLDIKKRQAYFKNLLKVILDQKEEIAELIAKEQGKPFTESLASEIFAVLAIIKDLIYNAQKTLKSQKVDHQQILFVHKKSEYQFISYGVVAIISPWNYPFSVPLPEIATALVTGNTVLFKPAPDSIFVGQKINELFRQAGFPEGVLQTVFVEDRDAPFITSHSLIDKIVFTGSTLVGKEVMTNAAQQMTPVVLELGGNDPAIVASDANIERAAKGIVWGSMFNAGQVCAGVERVYVEKPIAQEFIEKCINLTKSLKVGDPLEADTQIGPMSNMEQLLKVQSQIEDAVNRGAVVQTGGKRFDRKGYFLEPTVLTNVDHTMDVMIEETFGPVLPIMVVDSLGQAIDLANDSIYGLSAYGWTGSKQTAERLVKELHAGTVMINDTTSSWGEPKAPWGGVKMSGIGRTRARFGLEEMVQVKYVSLDKGTNKYNPWWYPYNLESKKFISDAAQLVYSTNLVTKMTSLFKVLFHQRFYQTAYWGAVLKNVKKLF